MYKVWIIALNTYREAIRNKVLYAVLFFSVMIVAISAIFGSVTIGDQVVLLKDFGLFSLSFFGAIATIICGVSLLNKEIKQKTIYNILSKPVERWQFIVGKYFGLMLTAWTLVSLMGFGLIFFIGLFEGKLDWLLFEGLFLALLEVAVIAAVTIFFSSLVITTTLSGLFTFGTYLAGRSVQYLKHYLQTSDEHRPLITNLMQMLHAVLPDLSLFNFNDALVYGVSVEFNTLAIAFAYCISYSAILLVLAKVIFERRELT